MQVSEGAAHVSELGEYDKVKKFKNERWVSRLIASVTEYGFD